MEITGNSAEEVWKKALRHVLGKGQDFTDKDSRICREILGMNITIKSPDKISKPIEILNSFQKWVYPPLDELENFIFSKKEMPGYYYNYGARTFNFEGVNQVDNYIVPLLKKDTTSRRASVIFYNPLKDSSLFRKDTPGMISVNFNVRDNKLNAFTIIRSNDLFFGWPGNIYQIFVLQKYVAEKLGVETGRITTISISAHIFEDQFEHIKKVLG